MKTSTSILVITILVLVILLMGSVGLWYFFSGRIGNRDIYDAVNDDNRKCIDYIYCRNNSNAPTVNVISASVILKSKKYPNIKDYSDHYPVKVVVAW